MAKARRTRTLRNRKSRNRRGGLFGFSDVEKFKAKLESVASIKQIIHECREEKNCKIDPDNLGNIQKQTLEEKIVKILTSNEPGVKELKEYITNLGDDDLDRLKDELYQAEKSFVYINVAAMCKSEEILKKAKKRLQDAKDAKDADTMADILKQDVTQGVKQGGGKSRRRHRRGRTLHKRRKSRKVRKTRCRRK